MKAKLWIAVLLNLVLPGSGLIMARRPWLGFSMSVFFAACANLVIWGFFIAPYSLRHDVTATAAGLAAALWIVAQVHLIKRIRSSPDDGVAEQLTTCHDLAEKAMQEGRHDDAYGALSVALTVDDRNLQTYVKLARLTTMLGKYGEARQAWDKVEQLDRTQVFRREMIQSLERMPFAGTQID